MVQRVKPWTRWSGGALSVSMSGSGAVDLEEINVTGTGAWSGGALSVAMAGSGETSSASDLSSDWLARSTAPGVVWAHNFEHQAEVDNFRFEGGIGIDKSNTGDGNTRWVSNDGFDGGGCLEINIPNNDTCESGWWRFFSPMNGTSNGRGVDDPGANGTISLKAYNPNNTGAYAWTQGWYGHSSYSITGRDGTDFYIQYRVKLSANRAVSSNPDGKLIYIDTPNGSNQEIVIKSGNNAGNHRRFNMYTNFGSRANSYLYEPQDDGGGPYDSFQPGGEFADTCDNIDGGADSDGSCWLWPIDEWVTLLIHVTPGREGVAETGIEAWVAEIGATEYTKIWDKTNYVWDFDSTEGVNGFNVTKLAGYMNSNPAVGGGWTQRFTQVIFSKNFIPAPRPAPAWFETIEERRWYAIADGSSGSADWQKGDRISAHLPAGEYGGSGQSDVVNAWTGGCASQSQRELYLPAQGGHAAWGGNEIYAVNLGDDTPGWSRIWGPSPAADRLYTDIGNNPAICKFGTNVNAPRTIHGWFAMQCDVNDRIWMSWMPGYHEPAGRGANSVWSIDRHDLDSGWTHHGRIYAESSAAQSSSFGHQSSPCAYDPVANIIWQTPEGDVRDPNPGPIRAIDCAAAVAAGQQADTGPQVPGSAAYGDGYGTQFGDAWSVVLSNKSPRCWLINGSSGLRLYDVESPGTGFTSISASGTNPGRGGRNAVYIPSHSAVYVFGTASGATVSKLTITGSDPETATYAWSTLTNNSGSLTPSSANGGQYQGDFGKAQGIVDMGNGQACLVIAPNHNGPTYVYKLPA